MSKEITKRCISCGLPGRYEKNACDTCIRHGHVKLCADCYLWSMHPGEWCGKCRVKHEKMCPYCGNYYRDLNSPGHTCYDVMNFSNSRSHDCTFSTFNIIPFHRAIGLEVEARVPWGGIAGPGIYFDAHSEHSGRVTEVVSMPCKGDEILKMLAQLDKWFTKLPSGSIDELCGLHVHVDAIDFTTVWDMQNLLRIMLAWENEIWDYSSVLMLRNESQYCMSLRNHSELAAMLKAKTVPEFMRAWRRNNALDFEREPRNRYWMLNMDAWIMFKTMEFRCHEATDDTQRITFWTLLCMAIVEYARKLAGPMPSSFFDDLASKHSICDLLMLDEGEFKVLGLNPKFFPDTAAHDSRESLYILPEKDIKTQLITFEEVA